MNDNVQTIDQGYGYVASVEQRNKVLRNTYWLLALSLVPTVRLGLWTSLCGFAALLFSGFPGLVQLGVFSMAGLTAAALTTLCVFPSLAPNGAPGTRARQRTTPHARPLAFDDAYNAILPTPPSQPSKPVRSQRQRRSCDGLLFGVIVGLCIGVVISGDGE